jgi:hypothetical protein
MKVQRLSRNRVRVISYYMETGDICINEDIVQSLQKCKSSTLKAFVGQIYA